MIDPERFAAAALHGKLWVLGSVLSMAVLVEAWRPERARLLPRAQRWSTNLGLYFLGEWLFRLVIPYSVALELLTALGGPIFSPVARIGAFGGPWAVFAASCLLLDLVSYLLHRLEHAVFPLWRLHSVHHADIDVDATTAVRHHPFETIFIGVAMLLLVVILGVPPWAWAAYAALVLVLQLAQHANVRLPARLDAALGLLLMTPGLHRTHHASTPEHYNSNFGAALTVWDRCFQTLAPPLPEQNPPSFGVAPFQASRSAGPHWALLMPFVIRSQREGPRETQGARPASDQALQSR
jgi:sterol desaturase/sphingolipid hydroxylase (fatty acid hydroxylase superfamily)